MKFLKIVIFFCVTIAISAHSQFGADLNIIDIETLLSLNRVQIASEFQIAIVLKFADGWHANANPAGEDFLIPTKIEIPDQPNFTFDKIIYPKGEIIELASIGRVPLYHDETVIGVSAIVSENADLGEISLPIKLTYQACNDESCLMPTTIDLTIKIEIVGIDQSIMPINSEIFAKIAFEPKIIETQPITSESGKFLDALSRGYFWAFLFVFLGGLATSLTPCVYPLIPITVSIFGASGETGKIRSFLLSIVYVLGMAVMYSILGVIVASTGAVFGAVMVNPIVIGFVSFVLIALGLSMIGVFELRLPNSIQTRLNTIGGAGFGGAFAMGTVAGVIAAPCTGPALGAVLSFVATTGSMTLGFFLMLTYAIGMGLLFILIGTFSGLLNALPRSGGWMYVLENVFGIAIIAMALFFLKNVISLLNDILNFDPLFLTAIILTVVGMVIGELSQRFKDLNRSKRIQKAIGISMAVFGVYMIAGGLTIGESSLDWIYDEADAFEIAKRQRKPIMIDFYADWCGACKELEHKTYADPKVTDRLSKFVNVKIDFTNPNNQTVKNLKDKYNIKGLPVVIFFDSDQKMLSEKRIEKFVNADQFLELIRDIE